MTTEHDPQTSAEVNPSVPLDAVEEIRLSMLGQETALDSGSPESRSFAAVQDFHQYLLRRGWAFESAESLVIWTWPPSRIEEDGYGVLTTDVWIDVEDAGSGPDQLRVNISLVGEKDDGLDGWTLEFELYDFDDLPLDQAEAFRVGSPCRSRGAARTPRLWRYPTRSPAFFVSSFGRNRLKHGFTVATRISLADAPSTFS